MIYKNRQDKHLKIDRNLTKSRIVVAEMSLEVGRIKYIEDCCISYYRIKISL